MPVLSPTVCLESFDKLDLDEVTALTDTPRWFLSVDLDGSVIGHHDDDIPDSYLEKFAQLGRDEQLAGLGIISNTDSEPRDRRANYLADQIGEAASREVVRVSSYNLGYKKPRPAIFKALSAEAGVPAKRMLHLGDQWFKDILGANLAGYGATALVPPYHVQNEHPLTHYLQRPAEALLRPFFGLPLRAADFGRAAVRAGSPGDHQPNAEDYAKAKRIAGAGAVAFGLGAAAAGILDGELLAASAIAQIYTVGLANAARTMGQFERQRRITEKFTALQGQGQGEQAPAVAEDTDAVVEVLQGRRPIFGRSSVAKPEPGSP